MKKTLIFLIIAALLVLTLTSCGIKQDADFSPDEKASYYFENKNGELNAQKWISFSTSGWKYYDGTSGQFIKDRSVFTLTVGENVWGMGSFSDGNFTLERNGRTVTYYAIGSELPKANTAFTMRSVYEKAVELGFEGTLDELIAMFRGEAGKSAYDLAVERGYEGSEAQWIASLAGSEGKTPTIGKNGHWYVGDTDTGVSAAGNNIYKIERTAQDGYVDTYTIYLTDGQQYDFTVTNGMDGQAAARGTGIRKIEKTNTDGNVDTYTIYLTDDTSYDFTVTSGRDGVDGKDGKDGKNGVDGKDATALTALDIYEEAVEQGYEGSYLDFLNDYMKVVENDMSKINAACFSTVSIVCSYRYSLGGLLMPGTSSGTGIIYQMNKEAGDAYILTNYHVVFASEKVDEEAKSDPGICDDIFVYLYGSEVIGNELPNNDVEFTGMYMEAEYIGGSMNYDLALLKITGNDRIKNSSAKAITFADSNKVSAGDTVYAVGNGGGDGIAVTKGIVNYTSENLSMTGADGISPVSLRVLRYDAAVNPGNSGGALLNARGELLGVVNAKMIDPKYDDVGYAIPSVVAKNVVENILYYYEQAGEAPVNVKRLVFGITYTSSEAYAEYDPVTGGVERYDNMFVVSVGETSLVAGKIEAGDVITKISVERDQITTEYVMKRAHVLADLTTAVRAGDRLTLYYKRIVEGVETLGQAEVVVTENNLVIAQ